MVQSPCDIPKVTNLLMKQATTSILTGLPGFKECITVMTSPNHKYAVGLDQKMLLFLVMISSASQIAPLWALCHTICTDVTGQAHQGAPQRDQEDMPIINLWEEESNGRHIFAEMACRRQTRVSQTHPLLDSGCNTAEKKTHKVELVGGGQIQQACVDMLHAYRINCASTTSPAPR
eukprot:94276-Amphidinium_carterae.1